MKRHFSFRVPTLAIMTTLVILTLCVSVALALVMSNADGKWSDGRNPSGGTNVRCLRYGSTTQWSTNVNTYQDTSNTDENQTRWGDPNDDDPCQIGTSQSGFGFNGTNGPLTFDPGVTFLLGKFTHYNNPVYMAADGSDKLATVDLAVTLNFSDPAGLNPVLNYVVNLDETPNNANPCPYGDSTGNGCDDRVTFPATVPDQTFDIGGVTYTLQIIGFVPHNSTACPASPAATPVNQYTTGERQNNYACLYAKIVLPIDSGDALDFSTGQTLGGTRARHNITSSGPYLGALRGDGENDGQPTANALGDDTTDFDDEDGLVSLDPLWADGGSVTVSVNVGSASRACVYAWVDWAGDGFGVGSDSTAQGYRTSTGNLTLTFPDDANMPAPGAFPASAFLRLRVKSGTTSCDALGPTGLAADGEVEDHLLSFGPNAVGLSSFSAAATTAAPALAGLASLGGLALAGLALRRRK